MFYDRFVKLCKKKGVSPSKAAAEMGMNRSIVTFWKKGTIPKMDTLNRIATYFDVSVDYLAGGTPANLNSTGPLENAKATIRSVSMLFRRAREEAGLSCEQLDTIMHWSPGVAKEFEDTTGILSPLELRRFILNGPSSYHIVEFLCPKNAFNIDLAVEIYKKSYEILESEKLRLEEKSESINENSSQSQKQGRPIGIRLPVPLDSLESNHIIKISDESDELIAMQKQQDEINDDIIKRILFGNEVKVTDEMLAEVKRFAKMLSLWEKEEQKKNKRHKESSF